MKLFITFLILLPGIARSQEKFNFSPDQPRTLKEVQVFESTLNSQSKGISHFKPYLDEDFGDMIPEVEPKALIYKRTTDDFTPNLATWYFFNKDSIVTGFFYNWAFYNPEFNPSQNLELLEGQKGRLNEYQKKFEEVEKKLITILGEADKSRVISRSKKRYIEQTVWDDPKYRTVLILDYSPELTKIPGTDFIAGGDSRIIVKTFYK